MAVFLAVLIEVCGNLSIIQRHVSSLHKMVPDLGAVMREWEQPIGFSDAAAMVAGILALVATFNVAIAALALAGSRQAYDPYFEVGHWMNKVSLTVRFSSAISLAVTITQLLAPAITHLQRLGMTQQQITKAVLENEDRSPGGPFVLLLLSIVTIVACDLLMGLEMRALAAKEAFVAASDRKSDANNRFWNYKRSLPAGLYQQSEEERTPKLLAMYVALGALVAAFCILETVIQLLLPVYFSLSPAGPVGLIVINLIFTGIPLIAAAASGPVWRAVRHMAPDRLWLVYVCMPALILFGCWQSNPTGVVQIWLADAVGVFMGLVLAYPGNAEKPIFAYLYLIPLGHLARIHRAAVQESKDAFRDWRRSEEYASRARPQSPEEFEESEAA